MIQLDDSKKTFIIAEAGSNHDGDINQAKQLIDIASEAGADAVKFQVFKSEKLYHKNVGNIDLPGGNIDFFDFLKKMEMPKEWIPKLKTYCNSKGIEFMFSVFDIGTLKYIEDYNIQTIKIASPELNYIQLFEQSAKSNKTIIFSTGISKLADIERSVEVIEKYHSNYAILHCITSYPASIDQCNLGIIKTLKNCFEHPVGLSDHTMDYKNVPGIAVALGANIIEKHFTISRKLNGPDHKFAIEPKELKIMVDEIRKIDKMTQNEKEEYIKNIHNSDVIIGRSRKVVTNEEKLLYKCDRRSIISIKKIKKGERITIDNISILRAERNIIPGLEPKYLNVILNKRVNKDIVNGIGLNWDDFLDE